MRIHINVIIILGILCNTCRSLHNLRFFGGPSSLPEISHQLQRSVSSNEWLTSRKNHAFTDLTDQQLKTIAGLSDQTRFMNYLRPIAVPRVAGTSGNQNVQKFLISKLTDLGYSVETHNFQASPPTKFAGYRNMTNIMGTLDPKAPRRLVLSCHFDSKYDPYGQFIGVTDSAAPCAQMLDVAHALQPFLKQRTKNLDVTLQLLFFDGEEAFGEWSSNDSLYGSRQLVAKMKSAPNRFAPGENSVSEIQSIDILVLLDLIGTKDVTFRNFYYNAKGHFDRLNKAENRLTSAGLIKEWGRGRDYFDMRPQYAGAWIDDDYRPFNKEGVRVLHLISTPFPSVWHQNSDNLANFHYQTTDDITTILRVYVCEYLSCDFSNKIY